MILTQTLPLFSHDPILAQKYFVEFSKEAKAIDIEGKHLYKQPAVILRFPTTAPQSAFLSVRRIGLLDSAVALSYSFTISLISSSERNAL